MLVHYIQRNDVYYFTPDEHYTQSRAYLMLEITS